MAVDRSRLARDNRQICIQMERMANYYLAASDVTGVQAQMLLYILRHSETGVSVTDLHQISGYSKATISNLVKRLREKGYIRVEACEEDDRRRLLFSTEKGRRIQALLAASIREVENSLYRGLSAEELSTLDQLQKRMLQNLIMFQTQSHKEASAT
ncbi:MarR family winged helix-turn-helix transcriptional regulator [Flavonifractor sp. An9]|uniref:MarR family winged helix-turn-helix transcriptional regulator n=1 Tax=Flavonifractor sp. An9 TaxID=1965664 RepID=UPI000B3AFB9D|nr:MarR family transcriptional regulator [Flavonifractor sp. An9]OUN11186.1 MarR family transcriptional regulator [Flavonifractor sp. An9]